MAIALIIVIALAVIAAAIWTNGIANTSWEEIENALETHDEDDW